MTGPERAETVDALLAVLQVLEDLGLRYHLGGSYASSMHGVPRQTLDADLVVDLDAESVPRIAERLRSRPGVPTRSATLFGRRGSRATREA